MIETIGASIVAIFLVLLFAIVLAMISLPKMMNKLRFVFRIRKG